jgi:hypothetical protein
MKIFLPRIAASTKRGDIFDFVVPALKNGLFRKAGRILNLGKSRCLAIQLSAENAAIYLQRYAERTKVYTLLNKLITQYRDSGIQFWITSIAESAEI